MGGKTQKRELGKLPPQKQDLKNLFHAVRANLGSDDSKVEGEGLKGSLLDCYHAWMEWAHCELPPVQQMAQIE